MAITPKMSMWLSVIIAILSAVASGTIKLSGIVADPVSIMIVQWCAFIVSVYAVGNAALHAVSSQSEGPMAYMKIKFEKIPPKVGLFLIMAFMPLMFLHLSSTEVYAKTHKVSHVKVVKSKKPVLFGRIKNVPLKFKQFDPIVTLTKQPEAQEIIGPRLGIIEKASSSNPLADLLSKVQTIALADVTYANQLALANNDLLASQCYSAVITFITQQTTGVIGPDGQPMTPPSIHLVTDTERLILLYRALQPTSELNTQCAAFMNVIKVTTVQGLLTGFGTGNLLLSILP
jgi:hypothetical protein